MTFKTIALGCVAAIGLASAAQASTLSYAQVVTDLDTGDSCEFGVGSFAYSSDRDNLCNSLGGPNGTYPPQYGFTSTGNFGPLEYTFGSDFTGPVYVWEVTGGSTSNWVEELNLTFVAVTSSGDNVVGTISNNPAQSGGAPGRWMIEFDLTGGPFKALQVTPGIGPGDKFDIDAIGVTAVPLPAAGMLLLAGLGGLAAVARRKRG